MGLVFLDFFLFFFSPQNVSAVRKIQRQYSLHNDKLGYRGSWWIIYGMVNKVPTAEPLLIIMDLPKITSWLILRHICKSSFLIFFYYVQFLDILLICKLNKLWLEVVKHKHSTILKHTTAFAKMRKLPAIFSCWDWITENLWNLLVSILLLDISLGNSKMWIVKMSTKFSFSELCKPSVLISKSILDLLL